MYKNTMPNILLLFFMAFMVVLISISSLAIASAAGGDSNSTAKHIKVGLCADYPPFEFKKQGELIGYDVDLAQAIAADIGATVEFVDMDFGSLIPAVNSGRIDMIMSGITATAERKKSVDFSKVYFYATFDAISTQEKKIDTAQQLEGKKIGVQLGSTMEQYAKTLADVQIVSLTTNIQLIQELKIGRIDAIICEHVQAVEFNKVNPELYTKSIDSASDGYVIAFKKGSALLHVVDQALVNLEAQNKLDSIKNKWIK